MIFTCDVCGVLSQGFLCLAGVGVGGGGCSFFSVFVVAVTSCVECLEAFKRYITRCIN